jgi:hypothetical protein
MDRLFAVCQALHVMLEDYDVPRRDKIRVALIMPDAESRNHLRNSIVMNTPAGMQLHQAQSGFRGGEFQYDGIHIALLVSHPDKPLV